MALTCRPEGRAQGVMSENTPDVLLRTGFPASECTRRCGKQAVLHGATIRLGYDAIDDDASTSINNATVSSRAENSRAYVLNSRSH